MSQVTLQQENTKKTNKDMQVVTAKVDQAKDTAAAYKGINKNKCFNLLVVDDQNTEW